MQLASRKLTLDPEKEYILEPKIDGVRCWLRFWFCNNQYQYQAQTRDGRVINAYIRNIAKELKTYLKRHKITYQVIFDGELSAGSWGATMAHLRTAPSTNQNLTYHVFDLLYGRAAWEGTDEPLTHRRRHLESILSGYRRRASVITLVEQETRSDGILERLNDYLEKGYEGIMVKDPESPYIPERRMRHWMKLKPYKDAIATVTGRDGDVILCQIHPGEEDACLTVRVANGLTDLERASLKDGDVVELYSHKMDREQPWSIRRIHGRMV